MALKQMDDVRIVFEDLGRTIDFFHGPEGLLIGLAQELS